MNKQEQHDDDETPGSPTGIYLNKRAVARIDLPLPHTMAAHHDGWRIDFGAAGRLRLTMSSGKDDQLDVARGDYLMASGEDLYVSLQKGRGKAEEDRTDKEERSRKKQEYRDQPRPEGAAS